MVNSESDSHGQVIPGDRIVVVNDSDATTISYQQVMNVIDSSKNGILKLTVLRFDPKSKAEAFSFDAFWPDLPLLGGMDVRTQKRTHVREIDSLAPSVCLTGSHSGRKRLIIIKYYSHHM